MAPIEVRNVMGQAPSRRVAIALGILVTFLWATSVVLIRIGLVEEDLPPLGFAGVRFSLAGMILLVVALPRLRSARVWQADRRSLAGAFTYGLLMFCVAQIGFVLALGELTAATVGLLLGLAPIVTAAITMRSEHERASSMQMVGISVLIGGVVAYFGLELPAIGLSVALLAGISIPIVTGVGFRLGRHLAIDARRYYGGPLGLTAVAMAFGGITLLVFALVVEGAPSLDLRAWLFIAWLAVVNTAFTYTVWTHTQRTLRAVEASALSDLTVILIAVIGWLVLDESLGPVQVVGLVAAVAGVFLVQLAPSLHRRRSAPGPTPAP